MSNGRPTSITPSYICGATTTVGLANRRYVCPHSCVYPRLLSAIANVSWGVKGLTTEVSTVGSIRYSPSAENLTSRDWSTPVACHFDLLHLVNDTDEQEGPFLTIKSDSDSAPTLYDQSFTLPLTPAARTMTMMPIPYSSAITSSITSSSESSVPMIYGQSSTLLIALTTSVITTTSMSPSSTNIRSPVSSVTTERDNKTLSGGAITGVALGAAFAVVALVTVGWFFCRYHRRIKALETRMSGAGGPTGHPSHRSMPILPAEKRERPQAELSAWVA